MKLKNCGLWLILLFVLSASITPVWADEAIKASDLGVSYRAHVQNLGNVPVPDGSFVQETQIIGTQGLRLEGLWIELSGDVPEDAAISYQVHVQNKGWMDPVDNGQLAGTTGESLQIEAIRISLINLDDYDIYYRGYVEDKGYLPQTNNEWGWAENGETLGSTGESLRLEELEIKVVKRDSDSKEEEEARVILADGSFGTAGDGEITDLPAGQYLFTNGDKWYYSIQNIYTVSFDDLDLAMTYLSLNDPSTGLASITGLSNGQTYDVYQVVKVDGVQDINILFHQNTILDLSDMQTDYLNIYAGDFMKTVYLYTGTVNTNPYTDELLANQHFCQYYSFVTMLNGGVTISAENMKSHIKMDFSDYGASQETSLFSSEIKYSH